MYRGQFPDDEAKIRSLMALNKALRDLGRDYTDVLVTLDDGPDGFGRGRRQLGLCRLRLLCRVLAFADNDTIQLYNTQNFRTGIGASVVTSNGRYLPSSANEICSHL